MLKYAHENGYPLDETCASAAYEYGPWPHIMEYLRENDCPGMEFIEDELDDEYELDESSGTEDGRAGRLVQ